LIQDVRFESKLYQEFTPHDCLVYCDPPYAGTTQYGAFDGFDHVEFWDTMREWAKTNTVVVSEYSAPDDWVVVKEMSSQMGLSSGEGGGRAKRVERLFMHKDSV
jgi:DNA adenine methylase